MPSLKKKLIEAEVKTASVMAPSGEAVAHVELARADHPRRALLVRGGAPDETLRAKFDPTERPARAEIVAIVTPSAARVEAPCAFVSACGGCDWMHLARIAQRAQHVALTESVLRGVTTPIVFHAAPRDLAYRTRARLHARDHRVGFFSPRSRDLVIVDRCVVLDARIDAARAALSSFFTGAQGDGEIALALGKKNPVADIRWSRDLPARVFARFDEAITKKIFDGLRITCGESRRPAVFGDPTPWITGADGQPLELGGGPGGFSQAYEDVNAELASCVDRALEDANKVIELYAGSGNLTVILAKRRDVRAIESDEAACEAARRNLAARNLRARVTCADASRFEIPNAGLDAVVLDPPRTGAREVCTALTKARVKHVVYVSCDRMTLARDLEILAPRFRVVSIDVFEMFPHTSHVETVVKLAKKNGGS